VGVCTKPPAGDVLAHSIQRMDFYESGDHLCFLEINPRQRHTVLPYSHRRIVTAFPRLKKYSGLLTYLLSGQVREAAWSESASLRQTRQITSFFIAVCRRYSVRYAHCCKHVRRTWQFRHIIARITPNVPILCSAVALPGPYAARVHRGKGS